MGIIALIVGLFCFLCVLGYFFSDEPAAFAFRGMVILAGLGFAGFVIVIIYAIMGGFQ